MKIEGLDIHLEIHKNLKDNVKYQNEIIKRYGNTYLHDTEIARKMLDELLDVNLHTNEFICEVLDESK